MQTNLDAIHRTQESAKAFQSSSGRVVLLAGGADTGGRFAVCVNEAQKGNEPPPHSSDREDEFFYVLDGTVDFFCGKDVHHVETGGFVFIPHGMPRTFRCKTKTVRMLVQATPADGSPVKADQFLAAMSEFLTAMARGEGPSGQEAMMQELFAIAARYNVRPLPPDEVQRQMPGYAAP